MRYGNLRDIDRPVSRIVFGTATPIMFNAFRSVYGEAPDFKDRLDAAFNLLDGMYAEGVNCFDCADHYGEEPLGEWLEARGLRDEVVILAKGAHHNRWRKRVTDFDILHDIHNTLAKLKTDRVELYMLHRDDPEVPVGPLMDALNRCYDEGKLLRFGASNWTVERFEEANEYAAKHGLQPFTVASPNFGLAEQVADPWGGGCQSIAGPANRAARRYYAENGIPVFAYSALGRGLFSGKVRGDDPDGAAAVMDAPAMLGYGRSDNFERLRRCERLALEKGVSVPQIALAWIFCQRDLDVYALVSTSRRENMRMNAEALDLALTDAECKWLNMES